MLESSHEGMSPTALLVSVVPQGKGTKIIECAKAVHAAGGFILFGQGTATEEMWDRLGITKNREIVFCITLYSRVESVMKAIAGELDMKKAGRGIIFAVSIDRFLSKNMVKHIVEKVKEGGSYIPDLNGDKAEEMKQKVEKMKNQINKEKSKAQEQCPMELLVVRMANGYGQEVMDCARKAGAKGGTIVHGRTSLDKSAVKFFNITIEPESDILFMLISKEITDNVLEAITKEWGPHTAAHAFGFVIPVLNAFTG